MTSNSENTNPDSMKIFVGSSTAFKGKAREIVNWLHSAGHQPVPWYEVDTFRTGAELFSELIRLSTEVDGAVFLFSEDDLSLMDAIPLSTSRDNGVFGYRVTLRRLLRRLAVLTSRDNVVFEYGLFLGFLGRDSVCRVVVGEPKTPTDLLGVIYVAVPNHVKSDHDREIESAAESKIIGWAKRLAPRQVTRFGFDLAKHLATEPIPVKAILLDYAPKLMDHDRTKEIRAVCSDKGGYGEEYYGKQFEWVKNKPEEERELRRVFVRQLSPVDGTGFSDGETKGILMHINQHNEHIQAKWVYDDNVWLGGSYSSALGFAMFGDSWILHWGLEVGRYHDIDSTETDPGVGDLLRKRFGGLWKSAFEFDAELIAELSNQQDNIQQ